MTPARSALIAALALYAAAVVAALLLVPWDAAAAPWADLATDQLAAFTSEQVSAIEAYVAAAWLPGVLVWIAPAALALVVLLVAPVRDALARIGPHRKPFLASVLAAAALHAAQADHADALGGHSIATLRERWQHAQGQVAVKPLRGERTEGGQQLVALADLDALAGALRT